MENGKYISKYKIMMDRLTFFSVRSKRSWNMFLKLPFIVLIHSQQNHFFSSSEKAVETAQASALIPQPKPSGGRGAGPLRRGGGSREPGLTRALPPRRPGREGGARGVTSLGTAPRLPRTLSCRPRGGRRRSARGEGRPPRLPRVSSSGRAPLPVMPNAFPHLANVR